MKIDRKLIVALLIGILVLSQSAYGISISVGSNAGGFTENINAGDKDAVYSSTVITANSLSHSIEGSASLKESHSVSNTAGANAGVGVDIRQAEWYSYSYNLLPGEGSSWKASKFAQVAASEQLDVLNAKYIQAYANAFNSKGYTAGVSTVVSDHGNKASLTGYRNLAMASKNEAFASQTTESAFAPHGSIQADSGADFMQLKSHPLRFRWDTADASTRVDSGSVEGYSDLASASAQGIWVNQQMNAATGEQIRTRSESESWTASLFQGLKTANAKVSTTAGGDISWYNATAGSSEGYAEADQAGHIVGTFTSTAVAGEASKTRASNYGNEYDFDMQARKDASGSYATGALGYYVDYASPVANRIQGAVDASESGDAVNVAPGTYFENVQIDKSLNVMGAGAYDTIVDGQQSGSVFTIGMNNPNVDVALSGMTIQGGSGTYTERWPGEPLVQCGGGVWNAGSLSLTDSVVYDNTANEYGSGIWSTGSLTVDRSFIYGNDKPRDGGGIWSSGDLIVKDSAVAGNAAHWNGGGIWSSGNMLVENSYIAENAAGLFGGGIANDMGQATVRNSTISANTASVGGGGIYNIFGTVSLDDSEISWNNGNDGGGILNNGDMTVSGGSVSGNLAANGGGIFNMGIMDLDRALVDKNAATENGGGVHNSGTAMISDSTISENSASYGGGVANSGTATIEESAISLNNAEYSGGGILSSGTATITGNNIYGNSAQYDGGGVFNYLGTATITDSTISGNSAQNSGGGVLNFYIGTVTIMGSTISRNSADFGGGVVNGDKATISGSTISENSAQYGGGVYNEGYGTVNLDDNSCISNNTAARGGGIFNDYYGIVNLNSGSIDHNNATSPAPSGGGIYNLGTITGNTSIVHDNTPDQIAPVDWLPEV